MLALEERAEVLALLIAAEFYCLHALLLILVRETKQCQFRTAGLPGPSATRPRLRDWFHSERTPYCHAAKTLAGDWEPSVTARGRHIPRADRKWGAAEGRV